MNSVQKLGMPVFFTITAVHDFNKIDFRAFFGLLITNPLSDFAKSRWRIQYCGKKIEKYAILIKNGIRGLMKLLIMNSWTKF